MTNNTSERMPDSTSPPPTQMREARFDLAHDVILSNKTRLQLDECLARLRFHKKIYEDWGFATVDPMGMTAILNFYGPPGTGKTLCAEALAGRLGLPFMALAACRTFPLAGRIAHRSWNLTV
ncbi:AAA family ATPase [Geopseudomonas aromaticivorans]